MKISVAVFAILIVQMAFVPSVHAQFLKRTPGVTKTGMFGPIPKITRKGMFGPVPHITLRRGDPEYQRIHELFNSPLGSQSGN